MISFLRGTLVQARQDAIIIEVSGIGYEIGVHSRACSMLPPVGSPLVVYTYLQVLDNDLKLYGFLNQEELELFKLLLGVSGLGAKSSLNILAALKPDEFCQTVISADEKRLQGVPGIGKKTAQRLVFELKDKLGKSVGMVLPPTAEAEPLEELMEALEALGYQRSEIFPLVMRMKSEGELSGKVEDNLKQVLRRQAQSVKK
ncbi:MAG TPA: Holliday junction branch migration protein RuvA [Syntrophomonadaceae bacterium]|jgi:Holliday junction DNA helicase RuvA|nr:Holliday junction branch migration protein RuvA [Syntrophomonadaceae bacterium]